MRRLAISAALLLWPVPGLAQTQGSDLSAGGLAPPPAVESQGDPQAATPDQTEADLARADREDSGRGLSFVWLNGEVGVTHFGLQTLQADNLVAENVPAKQTGLVLGAGLGLRLVFVTAGVRFRYAAFSEWKLWTLGAEGGIHMQLGSLEPYATLGLGYVGIANIDPNPDEATAGSTPTDERAHAGGFDARLGLGFDYYFTDMFSAGVNVSGDFIALSRPGLENAQGVYTADGSSLGAGVTATAVGGLHF